LFGTQRTYSYHDARVAFHLRHGASSYDVVHVWPRSCLRTADQARRLGNLSFREAPNAHTAETYRASEAAGEDIGISLPRGYSHRYNKLNLRREQTEFDLVDYILAPSEYVLQSFLDEGVAEHRLIRHQYGFDPEVFYAEDSPNHHRFTAVFVGRGEPAKGLHLALQAWFESGADQVGQFLIVGKMMPAYSDYLRHQFQHPSVQVIGFSDEVAALMRSADVLLFPTVTEGSALVTYEAMACGVVPLVSDASGAPIEDGVSGFTHKVGDWEILARQIRTLAQNRPMLQDMRRAAIAQSLSLTWAASGQRLVDAYRTGIERGNIKST